MGYAFGQPLFKGSLVALITPFKNGAVDEDAFRKHVDWQIEQGTHGLVPVGTTGESPTLSHEEHKRVIEICIEQAAGRVPVIAGAGSNSTKCLTIVNAGAHGVMPFFKSEPHHFTCRVGNSQ